MGRISKGGGHLSFSLSPNGQNIAVMTNQGFGGNQSLLVARLDGGAFRELLRVHSPVTLSGDSGGDPCWSSDGSALVVGESMANDTKSNRLWFVPIDGTQSREMGIDMENWPLGPGSFSLSPDGQHIAFVAVAGKPGMEIWALNTFL